MPGRYQVPISMGCRYYHLIYGGLGGVIGWNDLPVAISPVITELGFKLRPSSPSVLFLPQASGGNLSFPERTCAAVQNEGCGKLPDSFIRLPQPRNLREKVCQECLLVPCSASPQRKRACVAQSGPTTSSDGGNSLPGKADPFVLRECESGPYIIHLSFKTRMVEGVAILGSFSWGFSTNRLI